MAGDGRVVIDVILDDGKVVKGVADVKSQLGGIGQASETSTLSIGKMVTALGLVAAARKGIEMIKTGIQGAFARIDTMESFTAVMTAMTGSTEKAKEALEGARLTVKGTAYGLDTAAKSVQNFVTRGMDVDKATDTFGTWADAISFYGDGSNAQLANVTDALAKMVTSGKVGMDQLNRIFDAGIDAVGMYAQATGRDAASVQKDLSSGKITAEEFISTVTTAMAEGTNGVMKIAGTAKESGSSWMGTFDNMQAAVNRGVVNIIQAIDKMLTDNGLPDMRTAVAEFGKKFEEALNKAAESIPVIVNKIKEVYQSLEPWMPLITSIATGVGTVVTAFAAYNSIKNIIDTVKKSQMALNLVAMMNPWAIAAAAAIAAVLLIIHYWEPIKEFFLGIWENIKAGWETFTEEISTLWQSFTQFITDTWQAIIDFFVNAWTSITESGTNAWNVFSDTVNAIWDKIVQTASKVLTPIIDIYKNIVDTVLKIISPFVTAMVDNFKLAKNLVETVFNALKDYFTAVWDIIKNIILGAVILIYDLVTGNFDDLKSHATQIWDNIKDAIGRAWDAIKTIVTAVLEFVVEYVKNGWNAIKESTSTIWQLIKGVVQKVWDGMVAIIKSVATAIIDFVKNSWNNIKKTTNSIFESVKTLISNIWNGIKTFFTQTLSNLVTTTIQKFGEVKQNIENKMIEARDAVVKYVAEMPTKVKEKATEMVTAGKDLIRGLIEGIKGMASDAIEAVTGVVDGVITKAKSLLGIHSPSRVFKAIGNDTIEGMEIGMESRENSLSKVMSSMTNSLLDITDKYRSSEKKLIEQSNKEINQSYRDAFEENRKNTVSENKEMQILQEKASKKLSDINSGNKLGVNTENVVNKLRGVRANLCNLTTRPSVNQSSSNVSNDNRRSFAPQITNHFTPAQSTPSESARKQEQLLRRLAMEF